jgi:hypothetical protein
MVFDNYFIGGYFKLKYHMLLIVIGGVVLLMAIDGYSIGDYWWFFRLNYHRLLVVVCGFVATTTLFWLLY